VAYIFKKTPTSGVNLGNVTAAEVVRDVLSTSMSSLLKKLISLINHGKIRKQQSKKSTTKKLIIFSVRFGEFREAEIRDRFWS
jgi:hypothetical protein